jgi:ketosteroid isomerase-like protein
MSSIVDSAINGRVAGLRHRGDRLIADEPSDEPAESNFELVRAAYRLRLDSRRLEETARSIGRFLELLDPDVEFLAASGIWPPCQARRRVTDLLVEAARQWEECSFALEDVWAVDESRMVACGLALVRPAGKTEVYEIPFANVWTIEDGLATRIESFADRQEALEALKERSEAHAGEGGMR